MNQKLDCTCCELLTTPLIPCTGTCQLLTIPLIVPDLQNVPVVSVRPQVLLVQRPPAAFSASRNSKNLFLTLGSRFLTPGHNGFSLLSRLGQLPLIEHTTVRWEGAAKRESERRWVCLGNGYGLGRAGGAAGGNRLDHVLCMQAWTFSRWPSVSALHPVSQSAPGKPGVCGPGLQTMHFCTDSAHGMSAFIACAYCLARDAACILERTHARTHAPTPCPSTLVRFCRQSSVRVHLNTAGQSCAAH